MLSIASGAVAGDTTDKPQSPILMADANLITSLEHQFTPTASLCTGAGWMMGGGGVGDFNNNGLPDIFACGGGLVPDSLFLNNGDGTFTNQAEAWGVAKLHCGVGVAVADFNNNGWTDIFVTSFGDAEDGAPTPGRNKLYRNNGDETFTNIAQQAGVAAAYANIPNSYGAAWGDYNLNGHLDLYITVWKLLPTHTDALFRNNGDETFTNVTNQSGVFDMSTYGFQPAFADMNGNGWPDILLAADWGTSRYFKNNGNGTFTNYTVHSGTSIESNGMGHTIGDFNNNGLLDWYVTSVYPEHHAGAHPGNTLYRNLGNHHYEEIGHEANVHDGAWGWGAVAVDLDHDGWLDIVEVNGRLIYPFANNPSRLFHNLRDGTFQDIAVDAGMWHGDQGRGIVRLDINRDGLQDLVVFNFYEPMRTYQNQSPEPGNWVGLVLVTTNNPLLASHGFGARAVVEAGGHTYMRYMDGGPSYLATSELNLHFGLGDAEVIDRITITWPRGYVTVMEDVDVNQYLNIQSPALADLNGDGTVDVFDLLILLSKWGVVTSAHDLHADLNNDGTVNVFDLLILLSNWG